MIGEFLARLAVALPLVCGAAVLLLIVVRRGWIRLPGMAMRRPAAGVAAEIPDLCVVAVKSLSPQARVAVVRFAGTDHLVGLCGGAMTLLAASALPAGPAPPPETLQPPVQPNRSEAWPS